MIWTYVVFCRVSDVVQKFLFSPFYFSFSWTFSPPEKFRVEKYLCIHTKFKNVLEVEYQEYIEISEVQVKMHAGFNFKMILKDTI